MKSLYLNQQTTENNFAISSGFNHLDNLLNQGGWQSQTINEIVSQSNDDQQLEILGPTLKKLSEQRRWIVLIGAPKQQLKALSEQYQIASDKILLVHPKDQVDTLWAMEQALMSGTSSAVIAWPDSVNARDLKRLQLAAKRTSALAFVFNINQQQTQRQLNCHSQNQLAQHVNLSKLSGAFH
ncbi:SulA-like leucine-rich domain-containing protein [Psychrobium sp. 1_MG-2023]|uniref:SulA-like leucine-rich domain-containing protein n=1 Tax=Psychrobium sp. 1_MG-2023 TaxID=3062624 RepID=UPI000C345D18|nr:SulA-like leucine-rich domain-containing protein [Psychrobium sp. 1_MG-2023]MDP2559558.1 SulA-like leucine-rich domain-containing protein [Psychrobium sp. 1_MG-2023]PKF59397.1 cell division protein [Alteromonadales bacterium alter-6D02]